MRRPAEVVRSRLLIGSCVAVRRRFCCHVDGIRKAEEEEKFIQSCTKQSDIVYLRILTTWNGS